MAEIGFFWDVYSGGFEEIEIFEFEKHEEKLSFQEARQIERFEMFAKKCRNIDELEYQAKQFPQSIKEKEKFKQIFDKYNIKFWEQNSVNVINS